MAGIDEKCDVLERWARDGLPVIRDSEGQSDLGWFPTSLRTFCSWEGVPAGGEPDVVLRRNAFQTLASDPKRLGTVKELLKRIERLAEAARRRLDPKLVVRDAEEAIKEERDRRAGALLGYRRARNEARVARAELVLEKRAHAQTIEQSQRKLMRQDSEIADLRRQVSELTATLEKTTPIRAVR
jgi:hypothetical protein